VDTITGFALFTIFTIGSIDGISSSSACYPLSVLSW